MPVSDDLLAGRVYQKIIAGSADAPSHKSVHWYAVATNICASIVGVAYRHIETHGNPSPLGKSFHEAARPSQGKADPRVRMFLPSQLDVSSGDHFRRVEDMRVASAVLRYDFSLSQRNMKG